MPRFMADKILPAFSPLMPEQAQREIHVRTLVSQRNHMSPFELDDVNPVGRSQGYLLMKANSLEEARAHVSSAPVYRDTVVKIHPLMSMSEAKANAEEKVGSVKQELVAR